jgi:hypothetical protein
MAKGVQIEGLNAAVNLPKETGGNLAGIKTGVDRVTTWSPGVTAVGAKLVGVGAVELAANPAAKVNGALVLRAGKTYLVEVKVPARPQDANGHDDHTYFAQVMLVPTGAAVPSDADVQTFEEHYHEEQWGITPLVDSDLYAIRAAGKAGIFVKVVPGQG